ncbi:hypothetical protein, variant [Verruconis gallopava]|uniref:NADH-ubiquinone reductase complex 1 MLRQ subunit n=1 Tax=Verruconis gallopava TaxID=253628 RepID=A0A0D1XU82_9PEZI|nr:hypothetical protein, variant [Verruconis gallopava]KIW06316.1 hypothetical protein, variant [Verruconis gallopava]
MSAIRAMMRPSMLRAQAPRVGQVQHRFIAMKPTTRMMRPVPKEEHSAHTISQRLRSLKKIPPELIPLGVVLGFAITIAIYSSIRKFYTDRTLRLSRQGNSGHD